MATWKKTGCALCAQNCGLEVLVEDNKIVRARGDRDNPRSQGYVCHKGVRVAHYQHHGGRLTHPLKRLPDGSLERIGWDQALDEIAARLRQVVDEHGPRSLAYVGGGGQGSHMEAAFGLSLLRGLGSRYHYSPMAQELTGYYWVCGHAVGRQNRFLVPDEHGAEMLLAVGWNGMRSHQMPRAPLVLREFSKDPGKLLAVIDPRRSATARLADLHIAPKPGSDALLTRALIAIILKEGWQDREYLAEHVSGFEQAAPWLADLDVPAALAVCGVEPDQARRLCRELTTRRWCMHADLGTLMNRHSTATSYLQLVLLAICGRICVPGGNVIPGMLMPLGSHSDEEDPKTWRATASGQAPIFGVYPPNIMPEEISSGRPDRLRAAVVSNCNPLRSFADTAAYEEAFGQLDLLVTIDVALSETALASDYVLPARSAYESYDATFFPWSFPEVFFQLRRPVLEPDGEPLEAGEIHTRLARRLGLIPKLPGWLKLAARADRLTYSAALLAYAVRHPRARRALPFILGETLGEHLGSYHQAATWGLCLATTPAVKANAARAGLGPDLPRSPGALLALLRRVAAARGPGPLLGMVPRLGASDALYRGMVDHPEGLWIGQVDPERNFEQVRTGDGRINLEMPGMEAWVRGITPDSEGEALRPPAEYPLVLNAGRHGKSNANTIMRDPAWLRRERGCTVAMHPDDAAALGLADGLPARVVTEAGQAEVEVEVSDAARPGQVLIPHGFGLIHQGKAWGVNINSLTAAAHRDPVAATPLHRYVPCRVEAI